LIASAIPVSASVTEVLVITDENSGMRASTAWRAASRSLTTSTLNFAVPDRMHGSYWASR
jgi:hypothetical protein